MLKKYFPGDNALSFIYIILVLASLLTVFSATESMAILHDSMTRYFLKHFFMIIAGVVTVLVLQRVHYKYHYLFAYPLLVIAIVLLALTLVMGVSINSASRWLVIPGTGFTFQTSDFAKYALVNFLAARIFRLGDNIKIFKKFMLNMILPTLVVVMLIMPANLSTALLVGVVAMTMMFVGGARFKHLLFVGVLGLLSGGLFIFLAPKLLPNTRVATWEKRIEAFLSDEKKNTAEDYQAIQAKIAIATGGVIGRGPGNSAQKSVLPHPDSDFIFAIILEEYGVVGGIIVIAMYILIFQRLYAHFRKKKELTYGLYLQLGITLMIVFQAFINIGVAVGIFPVTGQPLPLVSMGGSSFLMTSIAYGILLSTTIDWKKRNEERKELKTEKNESNY